MEMSTIFNQWAAQWGVPAAAIADLQQRYVLACQSEMPQNPAHNSESYVQSQVRLAAPRAGMLLFRNNVGALLDERGVPVRYGLANDSKQLNAKIKSADLVGIRKVLITPAMVGSTIGQLASVEVKKRDWKPGEDVKRETAQKEWANLIQAWGGHAVIVNSVEGLK